MALSGDAAPPIDFAGLDDAQALRTHLASILASVPDAMVVIDEDGRIIAFSAAAQAMFGYTVDQVLGRNVSMLMTDKDVDLHDGYMRNYLIGGPAKIIGVGRLVTARRANGEAFPVDLKIGEAQISGGRIFTGYMRDVSEQLSAAQRLRELQAELVHFSRMSAVGTMASGLAHELNQPLTAVANYLEASRDLLERPDDDTIQMVREALDEAAKQSVRAGRIIRRLRDYVARGEIDARACDLQALLADAVALAKMGPEAAAIAIDLEVDSSIDVLVDPIQIQQVIVNLVRNATEALATTRAPRIDISARVESERFVSVAVEDNGPGLPQEIADQLFRPFATSKSDGMGLGLSICQTIIEAHGGAISAGDGANGGARFVFQLPRDGVKTPA